MGTKILALDVGYSGTKIVASGANGEPQQLKFPSGAGPAGLLPKNLDGTVDLAGGVLVPVEGEIFAAFAEPRAFQNHERPLHEDYTTSREYQALVLGALARTTPEGDVDYLVTGLPVSQAKDAETRLRLEHQLQGEHALAGGRTIRVRRVKVLPQPVGAWVNFTYLQPEYRTADVRVLVFDVGFYSVDWVILDRGRIQDVASGSSTLATSAILERASGLIADRHGARVSLGRLEEAVRMGRATVRAGSAELVLQDVLIEAAKQPAGAVVNAIKQSIRSQADDINMILMVGGGSRFYRPALDAAFPGIRFVVADNPVMANAMGFYRYGAATA